MTDEVPVRRKSGEVLDFIDRFAAALSAAGFPPMPARVFVALLSTDAGRLTAAQLADQLQVSPAAISGAVRYLTQVGLADREKWPGSRRNSYRVRPDVWHDVLVRRLQVMVRWSDSAREGTALLGADTPAGRRMAETLRFFEFIDKEVPAMMAKWHRDDRPEDQA